MALKTSTNSEDSGANKNRILALFFLHVAVGHFRCLDWRARGNTDFSWEYLSRDRWVSDMATTATLLWEIQRFPEHHSLAITFHDSHEERNKMIKHYQEVSDEYMRQYELFGDLFDQGEALNRSTLANWELFADSYGSPFL